MTCVTDGNYFPVLRQKKYELQAIENLAAIPDAVVCPVISIKPGSVKEKPKGQRQTIVETWAQTATEYPIVLCISSEDWPNAESRLLSLPRELKVVGGCYAKDLPVCRASLKRMDDRFRCGVAVLGNSGTPDQRSDSKHLEQIAKERRTQFICELGPWERSLSDLNHCLASLVPKLSRLTEETPAIVAGSYPKDHSGIAYNSIETIERIEWSAFLQSDSNAIYKFGDYGTVWGDPDEGQGGNTLVYPSLRYTINGHHLVFRSEGCFMNKNQQKTHDLIRTLVQDKRFCGASFSWGDQHFADAAVGSPTALSNVRGLARPFEWNHHLAYVARDVAALASPPEIGGVRQEVR
ncbi:beta family protein [Allorhodopirellula heiligendammensis]|uniref:Uncharacterized protein n=1 Tax=Allorhodopirellula heiligendammensis TaxID=2714739 RepID=A0A5C6C9S1_9BACT|nr:hypothetical protein [Allorhodopirellula heiligendammensis]TWU19529.1 hypothetical protein Poly21_17030 [Allorhodopirellula heiligendammensis]